MTKSILSWSGGKDAALSLYKLQTNNQQVQSLFTTVNSKLKRITMHGVHVDLLFKQVESLGYNLDLIELPEDISMGKYNDIMAKFLTKERASGMKEVVFGDIFLEDLKKFRIGELNKVNLNSNFPLWGLDTKETAMEFINLGFKAIVVATSSNKLDETYVGREFDASFINSLPKNVDPCGENGEFHTFVYDGPNFKFPIQLEKGEITYKTYQPSNDDDCFCKDETTKKDWDKGFWFCDLQLTSTN